MDLGTWDLVAPPPPGSKWVSTKKSNGFRRKSLKVHDGELGGVWTRLLNEPHMKHPLFGFWGRKWCIPVPF